MATTQTVNIDVNANTKDAEQSVENLERNISTLDGAINLVGGSIEVLAGGLAFAGAVTDEQAERFQSAAVGAIALADGSKRIIEGYKTLATQTKVLTVIQRIYNTVMKANPLFLIVGVIAAVTLGVIALTKALKSQADEQERLNQLQSDERLLGFLERQVKLSKARGESIVTTATFELSAARQREKLAKAAIEQAEDQEEARQKFANAQVDRQIAELNLEKAKQKVSDDAADSEKKRLQELENEKQRQLALRKTQVEEEKALEQEAFDEYERQYNKRKELEKEELDRRIAADKKRLEEFKKAREAELQAEIEAQKFKEMAIQGGIDNIQGALAALFGENKAVASANVLIDAAQAGVGIIKNSQSTGPLAIAYQVSQFALLAATTAASLKQINSTEPGDSGVPNTPGKGVPLSSFGVGTSTISGATGTVAPTLSQQQPMRAYVLATDVRTELEAGALLQTRRQFP
jgi:hypothetical protein